MKQIDEVTIQEDVAPFCPECGHSDNIKFEDNPFCPGTGLVVVPLVCLDCGYSFSLYVRVRI